MNLPKLRAAIGYVAAIALCFVVMALVAANFGCVTDPETGARTIQPEAFDFITNAAQRAVTAAERAADEYSRREDGEGQTEAPATGSDAGNGSGGASGASPVAGASSNSPQQQDAQNEQKPALALNYKYGGFNGGKAVEVEGCQIGSLKVIGDKLTYKWLKGGCEALGATSREDHDHTVACLFYWNGKEWVGGKFEWISTSRTSRGLNNVRDGYGGWDSTSFFAAKKHGFVIVSADGKKRSNFIED